MLRSARLWKFLKYGHLKRFSTFTSEIALKVPREEFLSECLNYDFKLCDLKLDEINLKIDMIEFRPYEKFFHSEEKAQKTESSSVNNQMTPELKLKYNKILDGCYLMKNQVSLPTKMRQVIDILLLKILPEFQDYVFQAKSKGADYKFAYNYINNIISNCHKNAAYMDVCIQKGDYEKAFNLMKHIRIENRSIFAVDRKTLIVDSMFYEPSINVLGKKGKLEFILELLNEMDKSCILPSISIIFRTLEAASKKNILDKELINRLLRYINKHNISLEDAFLKAPVSKDNFSHIMKSIQIIHPEFALAFKELSKETKGEVGLKDTTLHSTGEDFERYFDAQLSNEQLTSVCMDPVFKFNIDKNVVQKLKVIEDKWRVDLMETFEKKVSFLVYSDRSKLYPYLSVLPAKLYIDSMIQVIYQLMTVSYLQFSNINNVYLVIGDIIHNMYRQRCLKKEKYFSHLKSVFSNYFHKLSKNPKNDKLDRLWRDSILEQIQNGNISTNIIEWNQSIKQDIGRLIYEIMFENLNITFISAGKEVTTPVIYEQVEEDSNGVFISVKVQSKLKTLLKSMDKALPTFSQLELPMLHPPVPFHKNFSTNFFYLTNYATRMIRQATVTNLYDEDLIQPYDISHIYNALNVLGLCAWKVDGENLELVSKIFNENGNMDLKIPLFKCQTEKREMFADDSFKEKIEKWKNHSAQLQSKKEMYSLWASVFYKISIAKKFKNRKIWFPYSMDFRSRVYPCSPHFNHIGDDVSRGLLKFSHGKKLGPKGLDWLKIHLINLCGTHKRKSNSDRLDAANENLSNIFDSARNPLNGNKWWQTSEKPWQTLLACREIYNATKFADEKGNGRADDFISYLPVHQDGSCNGLQHYAALGKDSAGAMAVNLIDSNYPQDVYSDVLEHVERKRKIDAENGINEAIILDGLLTRKVIKQTVMTTVYGVTLFGAKEQVQRQLKEFNNLPIKSLAKCSIYLARLTLDSIGEIFSSASKIQNWFVEVAAAISKHRKSNISWVTPMQLIATQPYFDSNLDPMKPSVIKNRNAFPPNFIHSLDSSHMMMTALKCWQNNITFVSVHDCFWTHACDVDQMNKICRKEFTRLHSQPILENLSRHLIEKYAFQQKDQPLTKIQKEFNEKLKRIPKKGTFDVNEVLKSTYFFS